MMKEEAKLTRPAVSVIIPAYNAASYIEESVRSVIGQTFADWELLVIDDGSQDDTCEVVQRLSREDPRVQLIRNQQNMGVARTRNRGLDLSRGQYVALLDSDDAWRPDKLEKQLALLQKTGADLAYSSYAIVNQEGKSTKKDYLVPEKADFKRLLTENVIGCSTVILTAPIVEKYRFKTDFYHEDYVLWLQLLQDGCHAVGCREVLVDWRYIQNSRSFNKKRSAGNRWRIYRDYLHMPLLKSVWAFSGYAISGVRKYFRS